MSEGRPDYDVGDLVVCVDDQPNGRGDPNPLRFGTCYIVTAMWPPEQNWPAVWGVSVSNATMPPGLKGFIAAFFRKIDGAPEIFAQMLRETKPVVEKEPAL